MFLSVMLIVGEAAQVGSHTRDIGYVDLVSYPCSNGKDLRCTFQAHVHKQPMHSNMYTRLALRGRKRLDSASSGVNQGSPDVQLESLSFDLVSSRFMCMPNNRTPSRRSDLLTLSIITSHHADMPVIRRSCVSSPHQHQQL